MRTTCRFVGVVSDGPDRGKDVHAYTLDTDGGVSLTVWTYGATWVEFVVPDLRGRFENAVVRLTGLRDYEDTTTNPVHLGATLGRYARCVSNGRFSLAGKEHWLVRNLGGDHFHGGESGFDKRVWSAAAASSLRQATLRLGLTSPDGEQGYPGEVIATVEYQLRQDGQLELTFVARSDAPTIVGLTNHAYWNLSEGQAVHGHRLQLNAARRVECSDNHLPTGRLCAVTGTDLDYRVERAIGHRQIDHCFVLDAIPGRARLSDPESGRSLDVLTNQPAMALHVKCHPGLPRDGLTLQATDFPDAPNQPAFPSVVLKPGSVYRRFVRYRSSPMSFD